MVQDDQFDGTTIINHGDPAAESPAEAVSTPTHSVNSSSTIKELEQRIAALEQEFNDYKTHMDKKLKILEKLARKHQLSPEERVFIIEEDA